MAVYKKYRQLFKRPLLSNTPLATVISIVLIRMRQGFVVFFDRIYNRLNSSIQKFTLIVFCLLTCGLSLNQILNAFSNDDIGPIEDGSMKALPRHFQEVNHDINVESEIITEAEYNRLNVFTRYIDSLRKSKNGYVIYDSILQDRPGLIDSVQELHNLYESQLKNEK